MDDLRKRLAGLTPEKRALLERRLKKKAASNPPPASPRERTAPHDEMTDSLTAREAEAAARPLDFSLFYFSSDEGLSPVDKHRLLLEGAKFADAHGFKAVWTPERHFNRFGGLYPNPSVVSAALAVLTRQIEIRAGSVVLPLHQPLRVAEDWALVDNLSNGRVGVAFASGWHANDFVFFPDRYEGRRGFTQEGLDLVRRLWRGEPYRSRDGAGEEIEVQIYPRPIQSELPVWLTAAASERTFRKAGEMGVNLLTNLLGQTVEAVAERIALYRRSLEEHGHGAQSGCVTLMMHTFVGEDLATVRETVREPFCNYLRSFTGLLNNLAKSLHLPADASSLTGDDLDSLLSFAFERYFNTSGLFGTPESCLEIIGKLKAAGVDEVACLIDFGVDEDEVLANLANLDRLRRLASSSEPVPTADEMVLA